jgi:hypothetical protein
MYNQTLKRIAKAAGAPLSDIRGTAPNPFSGGSMTFDVGDVKMQPLIDLLYELKPVIEMPSELPENGQQTLKLLHNCMVRQGKVCEGLAKDILWGFEQSGVKPEKTAKGLVDLLRKGYIRFRAPDGMHVDENATRLDLCWVEYTQKLKNIVLRMAC